MSYVELSYSRSLERFTSFLVILEMGGYMGGNSLKVNLESGCYAYNWCYTSHQILPLVSALVIIATTLVVS